MYELTGSDELKDRKHSFRNYQLHFCPRVCTERTDSPAFFVDIIKSHQLEKNPLLEKVPFFHGAKVTAMNSKKRIAHTGIKEYKTFPLANTPFRHFWPKRLNSMYHKRILKQCIKTAKRFLWNFTVAGEL